jgi:type I restriction enzyme S subunit
LGKVGILDDTVTFNQQITSITSKRLDSRFLFYALTAAYEELQSISVGNTLNILNNSRLGTVKVPVPSLEEQLRIVQILDEETNQIDALVARVQELQSSLGKRREVLISEAVLGHFLKGAA